MLRTAFAIAGLCLFAPGLRADAGAPLPTRVIVSVRDQKLMVVANDARMVVYPVSTSKYGLGDRLGSMATPLGFLQVAQKIGDHAPGGAVFRSRRFTGEIIRPNAPGRDPVITRIIWLRGLEAQNSRAFGRCIYIHGTPEESTIGRPASYGCIRMKSTDVTSLYDQVPLGAVIKIVPDSLPKIRNATRRERAAFSAESAQRARERVMVSKPREKPANKRTARETRHLLARST